MKIITLDVTIAHKSFQVQLTPEIEGGYSVSVPALPGCFSQGETIQESKDMAKEAICAYLESLT